MTINRKGIIPTMKTFAEQKNELADRRKKVIAQGLDGLDMRSLLKLYSYFLELQQLQRIQRGEGGDR